LIKGEARRVRLTIDLVNQLQLDIERAHVTLLFPDNLIYFVQSADGVAFASDQTEEAMVSDSRGSLRLRAFIGPLLGRGGTTEIRLITDLGYAREVPVRVMVSANELASDASYYGAIVGVMLNPADLAQELLDECTTLMQEAWQGGKLSNEPGSGNVANAVAFLQRARPLVVKYYPDEMYRLPESIRSDASASHVHEVLTNALPALHNFKNRYS
jgi:hypothetical protein